MGTHKKITKKQGKDFYEIIVSVGSGYANVTSRVRRHRCCWFDKSMLAHHELNIFYETETGPEDKEESYSTTELKVPRKFYGKRILAVKVIGKATKTGRITKWFNLEFDVPNP